MIKMITTVIPIRVTLKANVIWHGDDVHKAQHPDPPEALHVTSVNNKNVNYGNNKNVNYNAKIPRGKGVGEFVG